MLAFGATEVGLDASGVLGVWTSGGVLGVVLAEPSGWCVVLPLSVSRSIRPKWAIMPSVMGVNDGVLAIGTCGGSEDP